mgnify:CR=1 FL=1
MSIDQKPWGGRFNEDTDAFVELFTASISFDHRLYQHDIRCSIAHAKMLSSVGIISDSDLSSIVSGLEQINKEINDGIIEWDVKLEDIHMNIESKLIEKIGEAGKKLHTARSRNDQIATDIRLYLRDEIDVILGLIRELIEALINLAKDNCETIMPGYTHLQSAQPITFGHHILAWVEMLLRDYERLINCRKRVNVMPLGSAALAGTTFNIDRKMVAKELGFQAIGENSLDSVSDRDFIIEFCSAASLAMMHFSRWSEELVLWTSQQFNFIDLPDRFSTGSSIMPQKKNPDVPELIRGKTGRVYGHLLSLLTLMKSQPLAYNKDNQEDKEPLFDCIDTLRNVLIALNGLIPAIQPKKENMREAANAGYLTATDLADYLVRKDLPFRDAHEIVGRIVAYAVEKGSTLDELSLEELQSFSPAIEQSVFEIISIDGSVAARDHFGGTSPNQVKAAIKRISKRLSRMAVD